MPILRGDNHKENTRMIDAELAAWIGLNETIFLEQLNFILKENNTVGQFADGRKWYRDKPRDFVVKYFPFWDEGIVKRAIDNLRADGLILARSDLNKDPKDRSLWYTVHYEAIDRLTGPVDRIVNKSAIRKQARQARKPKEDNSDEYTKVQNVLLNNEVQPIDELTSEVQSVPASKEQNVLLSVSTKCTDEKVQNVPTPKDSLPKELNQEEEKGPPPKIRHPDFGKVCDEYQREIGGLSGAVGDAINDDLKTLPADWIIEAMRRAALYNNRRYSYVQGILKNWQAIGGPQNDKPKGHPKGTNGHGNTILQRGEGATKGMDPESAALGAALKAKSRAGLPGG